MPNTCSVCRSSRVTEHFVLQSYTVLRCRQCSHRYVGHEFDSRILDDAYGPGYYKTAAEGPEKTGYEDYIGSAGRRLERFRTYLARVERYVPAKGALLDYGCAVGLFVQVARDNGWYARGYERSEYAVKYGREVLGLDIQLARDDVDPFQSESFDVVTIWDALEHFDRPRETVEAIHRWLKPGGRLALNTVNASSLGARMAGSQWRHFTPPHHLQYFTRQSLVTLLQATGFRVEAISLCGALMNASKGNNRVGWRAMVDRGASGWRARHIASALNLLDEVEVIAVKV